MREIFRHVDGTPTGSDDHPLLDAARAALEADPRPRMIKIGTTPEGQPIEINPGDESNSQVQES